jgi:hypothetical protein
MRFHLLLTTFLLATAAASSSAQTWENLESRVPSCSGRVFKLETEAGRAQLRVTRPRMCRSLGANNKFEVMYVNTAAVKPCREVVELDHAFVQWVKGIAAACGTAAGDNAKDFSETYAKRDALDSVIAKKHLRTFPWWVECDSDWDERCQYLSRVTAPSPFEYCGHTVGEQHRNKPGASEWELSSFRFDGFLVRVKSHGSLFPADRWGSRIRMGGTFRMIRSGFAPEVKNAVCATDGYQWLTPSGHHGKRLVGMRCEYTPNIGDSPFPGITGTQYCQYDDGTREMCGICYGNSLP